MFEIAIGYCSSCIAAKSTANRFVDGMKYYAGVDNTQVVKLCFTATQYSEASTAAPVGAVTDAKGVVHNGNIQLANMRSNNVVNANIGRDTLYKQAVFEIWPYITSLIASGDADISTFTNGWACCGGRTSVLREKQYVYLMENVLPERRKLLAEPSNVGPTVDEQIYGPAIASSLQNVKLIVDKDTVEGTATMDDALAVQFIPTSEDRAFHTSTTEKVGEAIEERINKKFVPFDMTDQDRAELESLTNALCEEIKLSPSIEKIASWLLFGDLKSKKWSISRAEMALNCLMWRLLPEYQFTAAIKLEPMPKGKAPRMLIADGDAGAVMSALTIGVLERYLCKYHKHKTIKGMPKAKRMAAICREAFEMKDSAEAHEAFMLENDGSAWDTCCSSILRNLTENGLLDVMFDKLYHFFVPYNWYQAPRKKADRATMHTLCVKTNKVKLDAWRNGCNFSQAEAAKIMCRKDFKIKILSIRRSGDRGTSILNFVVNLICWAWVLSGESGHSIVHQNGKVVHDVFGTKRRFKIWLEGDDSLLWLTGRPFLKAELEELEARWTKLGHRPKLFMRRDGDVAEFCGWKICVNKYGLDESTAVPDVPRLLKNAGYSTSKEAVTAAIEGDGMTFGRVVGPALLARAGSIAARTPTVARWLVKLSQDLGVKHDIGDHEFSRDDVYKLGTDDMTELLPEFWKNDDPEKILDIRYETFSDGVLREISNSVSSGGVSAEADLALKHGWVKTKSEWYTFASCLEAVGVGTSDADFRSIIPHGMKG